MSIDEIVKAWKDPEFRNAQTPEHPSGQSLVELDLEQLTGVFGEASTCSRCVSNANSCGYFCTLTTECGCYNTCDFNSANGCYTSYCCTL